MGGLGKQHGSVAANPGGQFAQRGLVSSVPQADVAIIVGFVMHRAGAEDDHHAYSALGAARMIVDKSPVHEAVRAEMLAMCRGYDAILHDVRAQLDRRKKKRMIRHERAPFVWW